MIDVDAFRSADALGIRPQVRDDLISALALFESGEVVYDPTKHTEKKGFNLSAIVQHHDKGVCACIFGWTTIIGHVNVDPGLPKIALRDVFLYVGVPDQELLELFWGPNDRTWDLNEPTLEQAIRAIRSYLTTGHAGWENIMPNAAERERGIEHD